MKFKINAGAQIETATPGEIGGMLDSQQQSWFAEMARGEKHFRYGISGDVTGGALALFDISQGPHQGFVWSFRRLSVGQLADADTVTISRAPASANTFINTLTGSRPAYHPGKGGLILHGGESLMFTAAGLTTTATNLTITGEFVEVPEFMLWKIL
jgi:hypothetical protein